MQLTKFSHACVLVEDTNHTALFDPGQFAWESGLVQIDDWAKLDYVMITHQHFDHFHKPFVEAIIAKFPDVQFFSTPEVVSQLKELGAQHISTESNDELTVTELTHDGMTPLAPSPPCQNVRFDYKNTITHPGDSIHFVDSKGVLFLPLAGPWEAAIDAIATGQNAKPRYIVPIHDWMWNDEWRTTMYDRMADFYQKQGIEFIKVVNGEPIEIAI